MCRGLGGVAMPAAPTEPVRHRAATSSGRSRGTDDGGSLGDSLQNLRALGSLGRGPLPPLWRWVMLFILVYSTTVSVLTLQARSRARGAGAGLRVPRGAPTPLPSSVERLQRAAAPRHAAPPAPASRAPGVPPFNARPPFFDCPCCRGSPPSPWTLRSTTTSAR